MSIFSVVFQDFKIFAFPVGENVAASTEYDENRVWQSLNLAGLDEKIRRIPKQLNQYVNKNVDVEGTELSGGEEQKLAIARAFYKNAPFYIFDEPTRGIDVGAKSEIYGIINMLVEKGNAVIVISSELPEILGICDRVLVFHEGRVTANIDRKDATQENLMYYMIGGN